MTYLSDKPFRMPDSYYEPPEYPEPEPCPDCDSTGTVKDADDDLVTCDRCNGDGYIDPEPYEPDPDDERDQMLDRQYEESEGR